MKFNVGVVIVCAGEGKRLGSKSKAFLKLNGAPLILQNLKAFQNLKEIREIVLVVRKNHIGLTRKLLSRPKGVSLKVKNKRIVVVGGGKERKDSVYNGLMSLSKEMNYVLIHDCARPFIARKLIRRLLNALGKFSAVICALKVRDTLKRVHKGRVRETLDREEIFSIQTPQGFKKEWILGAYRKYRKKKVYDDAQMVELMGKSVQVIEGDIRNLKITYPEDLKLAKALIKVGRRSFLNKLRITNYELRG